MFHARGRIVAIAQREFRQISPQPGWVEHDANEIWATQQAVALEALLKAQLNASDIAAIGITNQRETTVLWNRRTGQPSANAIVWQDRRTEPLCAQLSAVGLTEAVQHSTGLVIDPYFSGTMGLHRVPNRTAEAPPATICASTRSTSTPLCPR